MLDVKVARDDCDGFAVNSVLTLVIIKDILRNTPIDARLARFFPFIFAQPAFHFPKPQFSLYL
jgi:hypothetical protein